MKIGIIGAGISGCFLAIKIKLDNPNYQVDLFDHNDKLNKKIYATGNGKCNFANSGDLLNKYTNEDFILPILNDYTYKDVCAFFESIGIPYLFEGNLLYPMSKSAQTVGIMFENKIKELGINTHLSCDVFDYKNEDNKWKLLTNNGTFDEDILVFATGGKSSPQLGSNGTLFDVLIKHGYSLKDMYPSLCPIKTKENTKLVDGVRSNALVSIYQNNNLIHEESGELLFKDKGVSGIVIFNACHYINLTNKENIKIHCDFANSVKETIKSSDYIKYVQPKLASYLANNNLDIHNVVFTFKDFYDYSTSQVTAGGLKISNVDENLSSKLEKNVYFIGEILDVDAICGGFNMMWCFASANRVNKAIK